jgi:2-hydroxy-3-keto-5-methylthiopentenyl-1-phosphate phosphatase
VRIINPESCIVFFDFDNTIATCDVFDTMLPSFSRDDLWMELEKKWQDGKIGSRDCLEGQIRGMSITKNSLDRYLSSIKLDPHFKKLVRLLNSKRIRTIVLSDNFDYILKRILNYHNRIKKLKIYSNKLHIEKDRLIPHFPFRSSNCQVCAHCKTKNLLANVNKDSIIVYIGDGRSDICPAQYADIVFAKEDLLKHYKDTKLTCFEYKSLKDVYNYFKRSFV